MKRSGYRIRLEWFVPFDPQDIDGISMVNRHLSEAKEFAHLTLLRTGGMLANIQTKYQARRELPDEPKAAQAVVANNLQAEASATGVAIQHPQLLEDFPPIPPAQRRA